MIDRAEAIDALRRGGVVAAEDEADELVAAAGSPDELAVMVARRLAGEPTPWITGCTAFIDIDVRVHPGVYVPRWKTEELARHALSHLPADGIAVDLCTGSGAIAAFLAAHRPEARVLGIDIDPAAVECARDNGVEARVGHLFDPLPDDVRGHVDVVVAVAPYVPDAMLGFLPADVLAHEPVHALGGGADGLSVIDAIVAASPSWLGPDGVVVLEAGMDQVEQVGERMRGHGFVVHAFVHDGDGDLSGVCGRRA